MAFNKYIFSQYNFCKNIYENNFYSTLYLYSNFSTLDHIKNYSDKRIIPEDFMILEEIFFDGNMIFFPEKIFFLLKNSIFLYYKKKKIKKFKKIYKKIFFFLSKYTCLFYLRKQNKRILNNFFNNYMNFFLFFIFLFRLEYANNLFSNSNILKNNNWDFFFSLICCFKQNIITSQIMFFQFDKHNFNIDILVKIFVYSNSNKRYFYNLLVQSTVPLFLNCIYKNKFKLITILKIKYILKQYYFGDVCVIFNNGFHFYKKIQSLDEKRKNRKKINISRKNLNFDNSKLYLFKFYEKEIESCVKNINTIDINMFARIETKNFFYVSRNKRKYKYPADKLIRKILFYLNELF